jgi:hypothetical protein
MEESSQLALFVYDLNSSGKLNKSQAKTFVKDMAGK